MPEHDFQQARFETMISDSRAEIGAFVITKRKGHEGIVARLPEVKNVER
jgi:hypothetical protein